MCVGSHLQVRSISRKSSEISHHFRFSLDLIMIAQTCRWPGIGPCSWQPGRKPQVGSTAPDTPPASSRRRFSACAALFPSARTGSSQAVKAHTCRNEKINLTKYTRTKHNTTNQALGLAGLKMLDSQNIKKPSIFFFNYLLNTATATITFYALDHFLSSTKMSLWRLIKLSASYHRPL